VIIQPEIENIRRIIADWQNQNLSICLVPTMGYFHDGHISLMRRGRQLADKVVVSLFVNPAQFGPEEDLDDYPQDLDGDSQQAEEAGVDLLFCPAAPDMYNADHQTTVDVSSLSQGMCGADRPVHFRGVATVVTKLFNIITPDVAIFGEKDFQQLVIIKKMVSDLHLPIEIIGHEIIREPDGLAMSSRNAYLDSQERSIASVLYKALDMIRHEVMTAETVCESKPLLTAAEQYIHHYPQCSIDYLTIVDPSTLQPQSKIDQVCRVAGAININKRTRLIDNLELIPASSL